MFAIQDELGQFVVIEFPVFPRASVMALAAIRPQSLLVLVILRVAPDTCGRGALEFRSGVALVAFDLRMFSKQRETCQSMIELRHFPIAIAMAFIALLALLTFVPVVLGVTAETLHRRLSETAQVFVACITLDRGFCVGVAQDELGLVMNESPLRVFPLFFAVTLRTFLTQVALVLVILLVAAKAVRWRLLEHGALVALLALGPDMFSQQREPGSGVVEFR